ncbi:MAG TPA: hypothetical protein VGJ35_07205 [Burkholderiaceae bacterium]|jgi:hypothetical protein
MGADGQRLPDAEHVVVQIAGARDPDPSCRHRQVSCVPAAQQASAARHQDTVGQPQTRVVVLQNIHESPLSTRPLRHLDRSHTMQGILKPVEGKVQ